MDISVRQVTDRRVLYKAVESGTDTRRVQMFTLQGLYRPGFIVSQIYNTLHALQYQSVREIYS